MRTAAVLGPTPGVETDGSLEPLDVLRICGDGFTRQNLYVGQNSLADLFRSSKIEALNRAAQNLAPAFKRCRYETTCGGCYFPHRFSKSNGFQNPSFYCTELKTIIEYVYQNIISELKQPVNQGEKNELCGQKSFHICAATG